MKKIFLLVALCLLGSQALAQQQALKYYDLINRAELAICDSNLTVALNLYESAFNYSNSEKFPGNEKSFKASSVNLYNAFLCAVDLRQFRLANKYLHILLFRGVDPAFFRTKIFQRVDKNDWKSLEDTYEKQPNDVRNVFDRRLYDLVKKDQSIRKASMELRGGNYMNDSIKHVDSENAVELFRIINTNFPGSRVEVGLATPKPFFEAVIGHYYQNGNDKYTPTLFDTLLYNQMINLNFSPKQFAELYAYCPQCYHGNIVKIKDIELKLPVTIYAVKYKDQYYPQIRTRDEENVINVQRKKIGLGSLDELRKKISFKNRMATSSSKLKDYIIELDFSAVYATDSYGQLQAWLKDNQKL